MATQKILLYQRAEESNEDWWRLVLNADARRLTVEHEWKHGNVRGAGYQAKTTEIEINAFLAGDEEAGAQRELLRVLAQIFGEGAGA
jgi:hypothetical protein